MASAYGDKVSQRLIVFAFADEGMSVNTIHQRLVSRFGDDACCRATVANWVRKRKDGETSVQDKPRSGRPATAVNDSSAILIEELVSENGHITIDELANAAEISRGSVFQILHEHLGLSKLVSRWVPRLLTAEQKNRRYEVCLQQRAAISALGDEFKSRFVTQDESMFALYDPLSRRESRAWLLRGGGGGDVESAGTYPKKIMLSVFWDASGPLMLTWYGQGQTQNSERFCDELTRLRQELLQRRRIVRKGVLLHCDNARPHSAALTRSHIDSLRFQQWQHPPYSPDLAPSDYGLFGHVKAQLRGKRFASFPELQTAVEGLIRATPRDTWLGWIEELPMRYDKCIQRNGGYFEDFHDW